MTLPGRTGTALASARPARSRWLWWPRSPPHISAMANPLLSPPNGRSRRRRSPLGSPRRRSTRPASARSKCQHRCLRAMTSRGERSGDGGAAVVGGPSGAGDMGRAGQNNGKEVNTAGVEPRDKARGARHVVASVCIARALVAHGGSITQAQVPEVVVQRLRSNSDVCGEQRPTYETRMVVAAHQHRPEGDRVLAAWLPPTRSARAAPAARSATRPRRSRNANNR